MADKKPILEEALLDINHIQNALNANTKEILRSIAKEEINGVVKESLEEGVYEEMYVAEAMDENTYEEGYTQQEGMYKEGTYEEGMDGMEPSEELDMTDASDDEVIAIYKKMSGDDEIEIVGDELRLNISEPGEYVVKLNGSGESEEDYDDEDEDELELEPMDDMGDGEEIEIGDEDEPEDDEDYDDEDESEDDDDGEDYDYEIELDDEESTEDDEESTEDDESDESDDESTEDEIESEEEIEESLGYTRGYAGRQGARKNGAAHLPKPKSESVNEAIVAKKLVSETAKKYNALLTEATKLKAENNEFRAALKEFRTKLVETVVFNSNLTYVTKLFMEHSTTKGEKDSILKRFDEVTSLKESKKLYKTIANELEVRKPISESVENKIIKEAASGVSKQIVESTAYVDPSTKRIMDLINRVEKR
jgi:hypothetical protein